jgi:hypothetical protein
MKRLHFFIAENDRPSQGDQIRVARWFIFKPKNPNLGLGIENVVLFCDLLE